MAPLEKAEQLVDVIFAETSTLGVRITHAQRRVLEREIRSVDTAYGRIRVKGSSSGGIAPEYEDCRRAALEHNVPLRSVMAEASKNWK
jgi:hypothetical protein